MSRRIGVSKHNMLIADAILERFGLYEQSFEKRQEQFHWLLRILDTTKQPTTNRWTYVGAGWQKEFA